MEFSNKNAPVICPKCRGADFYTVFDEAGDSPDDPESYEEQWEELPNETAESEC